MATGKDNQLCKANRREPCCRRAWAQRLHRYGIFWECSDITDILSINPSGRQLQIQVKAIRGVSWQLDVRQFLDVRIVEDRQVVEGRASKSHKNLICVFVIIRQLEKDEVFIFPWRILQNFLLKNYKPRKVKRSNPFIVQLANKVRQYKDNWKIVLK